MSVRLRRVAAANWNGRRTVSTVEVAVAVDTHTQQFKTLSINSLHFITQS
jgi:hypothetical protein